MLCVLIELYLAAMAFTAMFTKVNGLYEFHGWIAVYCGVITFIYGILLAMLKYRNSLKYTDQYQYLGNAIGKTELYSEVDLFTTSVCRDILLTNNPFDHEVFTYPTCQWFKIKLIKHKYSKWLCAGGKEFFLLERI